MCNNLLASLAVLTLLGGCEAAAVSGAPADGNGSAAPKATPARARPAPPAATADDGRAPTKVSAPARLADFATFWRSFRQAALAGDTAAGAALARFPVAGRGELDDEPEQPIDRAAFRAAFRAALQQPDVIRDPKTGTLREGTMLELIRAFPTYAGAQGAGDTRRFGAFEFERVGAGWRLVAIYVGSQE